MAVEATFRIGRAKDAEPAVLELRVHGVNNTTAAALLDLRPAEVELVAGDKLGSFWRPTASTTRPPGTRGHVPPGIAREAYSWGGMVRTTPDVGSVGFAGVVVGVLARIFYALILPFSLANAVQWTWRLGEASPSERGTRLRAGTTRVFGLILTLLFTCTAATLALDIGAAQCAAAAALCGPLTDFFAVFETWTAGRRLAFFALVPVAAIGVLWLVSAISRLRYDVLPGMSSHVATGDDAPRAPGDAADSVPESTTAPRRALLAAGAFWSNRVTRDLARLHLAAAVFLTTAFAAAHASMGWHTDCAGLRIDAACLGGAASSATFGWLAGIALAACVGLALCLALTILVPTTAMAAEERPSPRWPGAWTAIALALAAAGFVAAEVVLVFAEPGNPGVTRLYGAGATPLALTTIAAAIVVTGIAWRPFGGRRFVAWAGCGPAVFMALALAIAVAVSTIVIVTVGDWLNSSLGAAALVRDREGTAGGGGLVIPSSYVAFGATIVAALVVVVLVVGAVVARPRTVNARAAAWDQPARPGDRVVEPRPGVLPLSQKALFARIDAKRQAAARLHLAEPLAGLAGLLLFLAVAAGVAWSWVTYNSDVSLWGVIPALDESVIRVAITIALPTLAGIGLLLVGLMAAGAASNGQRPLGIVWDVVCYLPRTGHPFGPPSYAERAVPEIAGRLYGWLDVDERRRAVLVAHSMGAVLAVSALALLGSSADTRRVLGRISLLTFGVQLRAFFGRMLPELLGPEVLGTRPSLRPRVWARDPWAADAAAASSVPLAGVDRLGATLLADAPSVRWISLWRLTDYLGFPAMNTRRNGVDRFAEELDTSGYMVEVGTHGEYYRTPTYTAALRELS